MVKSMKISELFDFEEIQEVIEIDRIPDEKELVEKFVISPNLELEILDLLDILKQKRHKSVNIIGNYGTGKSHLLAFLSLVLSKPELIKHIQSDKIKERLSELRREFVIVKYELPARQRHSIARIFFYRIGKQLKDYYGIEIRSINPEDEDKDTKELVEEVIDKIKEKHPAKGLLVLFDEFSDFLKQRQAVDRNYDLQFYRQLGECSNTMDFIFIASMQEYIFSDPRYVDQAESIARTQQRYKDIRITNENVEEIIAKRVVSKSSNQVMELRKQFKGIEHYFSNLAVEEDKYVRLFPIHPYVIEIFSILPFFEKRGIIQFLSREIKSLMAKEFPQFITYDLIYDSIDRVLTIRNHPDVRSVVDAVDTLKTKIDLLDAKLRTTASKVVKALAILCLVKTSAKNGATPQELANTLFIMPSSRILNPVDDIERTLENLRKVSDGQFINKSKEGVYYLDLQKTQDYDVIIQNRVANMNDLTYINEKFVESFLLNELDLIFDSDSLSYFDASKKYVLEDSAYWEDRKSFRIGKLVIDLGHKLDIDGDNDYIVTFLGYGVKDTKVTGKNHIIVKFTYNDALVNSMKTLASIEEFIRTKAYVPIMQNKKRAVIDKELRPLFSGVLQKAAIEFQNKEINVQEDLGIITDVTAEIFRQIKQKILSEEFTKEYPKYPKLKARLSAENIVGTVESVLKDIGQKQGIAENLLTQSTNVLIPLGLYKDNRLDVTESEYAQLILDKIEDSSKNVSIKDIVTEFARKSFGLQEELVYLSIAVLLRNGDVVISSKRGKVYSASDFNSLFQPGLKAFEELSYVKKEEEINVSRVQVLFHAIEEDGSLLQTSKDRPEAYRRYIDKIDRIEKDIKNMGEDFERLKQSVPIGLPTEDFNDEIEAIQKVDFSRLKIKSIVEFKKLDYSAERINQIKQGHHNLQRLKGFFEDYFSFIRDGIGYMKNVVDLIQVDYFKKSDIDKLTQIYNDSRSIVTNTKKLLKGDERRPLKGKIEDFRRKYKEAYYRTHNQLVGKDVDWQTLSEIEGSATIAKLHILKNVKCVNPARFNEALLKIRSLKDTKCIEFNIDELETNTVCLHCMFPNGNYDTNINVTISKLDEEFQAIIDSWEAHTLEEIKSNKAKVDNLDHEERRVIQLIISQGYLPEDMDDDKVAAINSLLADLEIKEVDLSELHKRLTKETDVLKVDEFRDKIEDFIEDLLQSEDTQNVRLRIRRSKEE